MINDFFLSFAGMHIFHFWIERAREGFVFLLNVKGDGSKQKVETGSNHIKGNLAKVGRFAKMSWKTKIINKNNNICI